MKLSTFLTKTLKSFRNGRGYHNPATRNFASKGYNLNEQLFRIQEVTGTKLANKAKDSISVSLGHTNIHGFETSPTNSFGKIRTILKAAIKRERANGN